MTITTKQLMDYTGYEITQTGTDTWEWTEDDQNIGVTLKVERVDKTEMVKVISHDTGGYLLLMANELETRIRPAVDLMQFAEHYDQEEWPFDEIAAVLNALDRDYGLSGYDGGIGIHCGFGMILDKAGEGYVIYDEDGLTHYAGTPEGLAILYPKVIAEQTRRNIGWINRRLQKKAVSES